MAHFNRYNDMYDFSFMREFILTHVAKRRYSRGERFQQEGYQCKDIGLVVSGYFKYTTVTSDGDDAVVGFSFPNDYLCHFTNVFKNQPSEVSITAGTDSDVVTISANEIRAFFNKDSDMRQKLSDIFCHLACEVYERYLDHYHMSPTERYLQLINRHPVIIGSVTMREIASYLMVTPVYLSRIRKRLKTNRLV